MAVQPAAVGLNDHQKQIAATLVETLPRGVCSMVADYCGSKTPTEDVTERYHALFIQRIGLDRLAKLPVVTANDLGVDRHFPWVQDESFPNVDVTKMTDMAVRGESSMRNHMILGPTKTSFIAIRYEDNRWPGVRKVELIWESSEGSGWGQNLFGASTRVTNDDYERLKEMLDGKSIKGAPEDRRTHEVPGLLYYMV